MTNYEKYLAAQLSDPAFKKEYDDLEAEYQLIRALINVRIEQNLTQKQLAERCGIRQSNLSRIETGSCSPTVDTLNKIAKGLGKKLVISFK